jgi:hypothetical protein
MVSEKLAFLIVAFVTVAALPTLAQGEEAVGPEVQAEEPAVPVQAAALVLVRPLVDQVPVAPPTWAQRQALRRQATTTRR